MRRYGVIGTTFRAGDSAHLARFHLPEDGLADSLPRLREACGFDELVYLATCNRVEVFYVSGDGAAPDRQMSPLFGFFEAERAFRIDVAESRKRFHGRSGIDAVRHAFRVAASLDSMVVGETQILGQVKDAYLRSLRAGLVGPFLTTLFDFVFRVAKQVRSTTGLGAGTVSMASLAARAITEGGADPDRTVAFIGSGEMIQKVANYLADHGFRRMSFVNRTPERVRALAERHGGDVMPLAGFLADMPEVDILVTATASPGFILTPGVMARALASRDAATPLILVDLAVPPDADPALGSDPRVKLVGVDDLEGLSRRNREEREESVEIAAAIVEGELESFRRKLAARLTNPSAGALRDRVAELSRMEVGKLLSGTLRHLSDEDKRILRDWAEKMGERMAQVPITSLKALAARCGCEDLTAPCLVAAHEDIFGGRGR